MRTCFTVFLFFLLVNCSGVQKQQTIDDTSVPSLPAEETSVQNGSGNTIEERFVTPSGYRRVAAPVGSWAQFLRALPLKPAGSLVKYYNGASKGNSVYSAVVDLPIGGKDLHQCADAVMRLRAEYLYNTNQKDKIQFNFTNGFPVAYSKFAEGHRMSVKGNKTKWVKKKAALDNADVFWQYLELVFMYAGTLSLEKELQPAPLDQLAIGDVFIQGGSPGHAVIVVDLAENKDGKKAFLLAQSYMPAQELQVLKNPNGESDGSWYFVDELQSGLATPEWSFGTEDLRRF